MTITPGDVSIYTGLVIPEHRAAENFMAMVALRCQPYADISAVAAAMPGMFDLDVAVGDQLDAVGEWIGLTRNLTVPLTNVYFSFDTAGVGFDQGVWLGPYDPVSGLVSLPDDQYRTLLRARIAANQWDGTIPGADAVLAPVFPDNTVFVQDNQDMSIYIGLVGASQLDAVTNALFVGGYLNVKPAGVAIAGYLTSSVPGTPIFGFDANNSTIGGFDNGSWANVAQGN